MDINVAVVCRAKMYAETRRKLGWWSYPVPDLNWTFYPVADGETINKNKLAKAGHDLIVWEDWCWPTWDGTSAIPIYAVMVDSNTSPRRRKLYLERAQSADVLLVDQDRLTPFRVTGRPIYRWQYAVNEQVFAPQPKDIDVAYHVEHTPERATLHGPLVSFCRERGLSLTTGGGLTIDQYAVRLGSARIVVHKATHEQCRSHRFFDALASGACLLSDRVWTVPEDGFVPGQHFSWWETPGDLFSRLEHLLTTGRWQPIALAGQAFVLARHTWRTRAAELVMITGERQGKRA